MGRVVKAGVIVRDTSIRLRFTFQGERHQPTLMLEGQPMKPTAPNVRYAHRLAAEITQKIAHGTFSMMETFPASGKGGALTVGTQLSTWLGTQRIEASTKKGYDSAIKFWTPVHNRPVRSLKHSDILKVVAERPDLSGKTINNYMSVLREAMDMAVLDGILSANPVSTIPNQKFQKKPVDPFTEDEAEAIIEYMRINEHPAIYNMVEWWFFTGVRTSELAGLRWPRVDFVRSEFTVQEAMVRGIEKDNTKTDVARVVKLNSRSLAALKRQKALTLLGGSHVWVDPRHNASWHEERAFRLCYWLPCLKKLGIRYRRPYNMRHTYATRMLMANMKPAFCATQMGHSVEIFHSTYAKWIHGQRDDQEMALLETHLSGIGPKLVPAS